MEDRLAAKQRRRPVTACSECHRRKQKCNRQKPCNHCTTRQIPSLCSYDDSSLSQKISKFRKQRTTSSNESQAKSTSPEPSLNGHGPPDEIGYSSFYGNDAYEDLKQLLEDEDIFRAASAITSRTQRHDPSKKFWALVAQLPSVSVQKELIATFYREVQWRYSTVEKAYFDTLYAQWTAADGPLFEHVDFKTLPRNMQHFPALLFQLSALTLQFVDVNNEDTCPPGIKAMAKDMAACEDISYKYSDTGAELLTLLGRHRTDIVAVQAYILRAGFLKNFGHGVESWYVIGDAIRQAQELELHKQSDVSQAGDDGSNIEDTLCKLWEDEYKRRLWVILFTWDSSMALILGRPRLINSEDCNIKPPLDCAFPENPSKTVPMMPGTTASPWSIVAFRYELGHQVHNIRSMGADKRCPQDYAIVWILHDQIVSLLDKLPLFLRPNNPDLSWDNTCPYLPVHRAEVVNNVNAVLMALHRPHITMYNKSKQAALQAGLTCLKSQQYIAESVGSQQNRYFGCAFYTINAVISVSAIVLMYPPDDAELREHVGQILSQAIERLSTIEDVNLIAKSGLNIARRCLMKVQASFDAKLGSITSTSTEPTPASDIDFNNLNYASHGQPAEEKAGLDNLQPDVSYDPFLTFNGTDFDTSFWISQVNQIPDAFGTDPTWDHLFANTVYGDNPDPIVDFNA